MTTGDILLINYRLDPIGLLIKLYTNGTVNHIAFALNENEVIEASGAGIKISPKSKFTSNFFTVKLIRPKYKRGKLKLILNYLLSQVRSYKRQDFYFDYLRMLQGKRRRLKSCAWFVAEGLLKGGIKLIKRHFSFCTPEDFNHMDNVKDVTNEFYS